MRVSTLAISIAPVAAQATWSRQSPLPYPPQLVGDEIAFSATRGYIIGSSRHLLETTDAGVTWHERVLSGAIYNDGGYYGVTFSGPMHGWIVGDNLSWTNSCYRTTDGGATWTPMNILANSSWSHVDFVSPARGWVGAWGALYTTSDGGVTWSPQNYGVVDRIDAMNFFDANVGVLSSQGKLRRTQDGGQTWTVVHSHESFAIEWLDASTVIASTHSSGGPDFARSSDGGLTWQTIQVPGLDLQEPVRVDATTLIAGTPDSDLYRSTDSGSTWSKVWDGVKVANTTGGLFTSPLEGFVLEAGNVILRTHDGGQSWSYASNGLGTEFEDVKMFDARRGLVSGGGGVVMRTDDGGRTWTPRAPGRTLSNGDYLKDLSLVAPSFAFAAGNHGTLVKTLDAGLTWQGVSAPTGYPNGGTGDYWACSFVSPNEGWIAGSYLEITHTTDGGATWQQQYVGASSADGVYDMDFVDAQHGWVVGTFGSGVLLTADGGVSWSFHAFPTPSSDGRSIDFVNDQVGWVGSIGGWVARTADGGLTWTRQTIPGTGVGNTNLDSIHAISVNECWVASSDNGRIFHTTNAGSTWTELVTPFHDPYDSYTGISASASGDVWVSGGHGIVSHFTNAAGTTLCFGDGSAASCPCGNVSVPGAQQGCSNSLGIGGALAANGSTSLASDTLTLTGTNMPNSSALYFQGTQTQSSGQGFPFGDGLRCIAGSIVRLATVQNTSGGSHYPESASPSISVRGIVTAPGPRTYQAWYRNAANFCTAATFNLTNAVVVSWSL